LYDITRYKNNRGLYTKNTGPGTKQIQQLITQFDYQPLGHIKHNLKVSGFLLRGLEGVKDEASILASCFNITRMISIIGITCLIAMLEN